jgi:hypothetical protein
VGVKMMTDFNKMFTQQEMKKLRSSYSNKSILEIIEVFRVNCEVIKNNILDTKWDNESKWFFNLKILFYKNNSGDYSEFDEDLSSKLSNFNHNFLNKHQISNTNPGFMNFVGGQQGSNSLGKKWNNFDNLQTSQNDQNDLEPLNTSYRIVNDKVLKLKRLEFDYSNLCEIIKNYIIVQELLVKHLFCDSQQQIHNEIISKNDSFKSKVEVIDSLLFIVEDTLFYKAEEMDEDPMIIRKVILKLLINQKQFLLFGECE